MLLALFSDRYDQNSAIMITMTRNYAQYQLAVAASFVLCVHRQDKDTKRSNSPPMNSHETRCELHKPTFELFTQLLDTSVKNNATVSTLVAEQLVATDMSGACIGRQHL